MFALQPTFGRWKNGRQSSAKVLWGAQPGAWSTVGHFETLRSTIKHGCVKFIVGESLTRELLSSVGLARKKNPAQFGGAESIVGNRELLGSTVNYRKAWMREDYRRCNLDQGVFVEYQACAQQNPSAALMSVAWSGGAERIVDHRELLGSTVNYRKAWMREDYRRYNLDQGTFVEYQACAQ